MIVATAGHVDHGKTSLVRALTGIDPQLYEAAVIDGAGRWNTFLSITLPMLRPVIGIVAILTFVGNFNAFDLIYTMKGANAGPDFATDIMGTLFYRTFFGQQLQLGNPTMGATVAAMRWRRRPRSICRSAL